MTNLEDQGEIFQNPTQRFYFPRAEILYHGVPTEAEVLRFLEGIAGDSPMELRDRALSELFYGSGLRLSEMHALNIDHVDLKARVVTVTGKGNQQRSVPMSRASVRAFGRYCRVARPRLSGNDPLAGSAVWLGNGAGMRIGKNQIRQIISKHARRVKLKLTPHDLRRAFSTHLSQRGASPAAIKAMLGHKGWDPLPRYIRLSSEDLIKTHKKSKLAQ